MGEDIIMAKERDNKESEKLPVSVTAYLDALLKKMRYRRKVRDDVRAELTAHFEDELKGCTTDEEKQKKAQQLITNFGDVKLLAILLRRAKKRCRPLWRTVVARTLQVIGILLLCFILYTIWFSCGKPTIKIDYVALFNRMNQPQIRDEDNAWPHYRKAIGLYVPPSPITKRFISYRHEGKEREEALRLKSLLRDNEQKVAEWLGRNQKHWDNLSPEKQAVVEKCFEYDWVPFPKFAHGTYTEWLTTTFNRMTEYVLDRIAEGAEIGVPQPCGALMGSEGPGFPSAELKSWLKNRQIPTDFVQAVSVAVLHEADRRYKDLPDDIGGPLSQVEQEYIGAWVKQNDAAWREFAAGSTKSYCYRPCADDPNNENRPLFWSVALPPLNSLRDLAKLGVWRSRLDRAQGRIQQSIEDCIAIARAGSHWQGNGTLVEQLVGLAICALSRDETLRLVDAQKLSAANLHNLQDELSRIYQDGFPPINLDGEKLFFMDVVQRSFTDGGPGGGHLVPKRWEQLTNLIDFSNDARDQRYFMPYFTALSMVHARRDATVAKANELYGLGARLAKMTPYDRHVTNQKTPDEILFSMPRYRYFLIQTFMPACARVSEIAFRGKMHYESTLTVLALKRWRLEKGAYPQTLNELIAGGFLKALPLDPYSDKPLIYRKTGDDFILYSVGPNFKDDDGKVAIVHGSARRWGTTEAGDAVLWPLPK
jgi:hypothetical protein